MQFSLEKTTESLSSPMKSRKNPGSTLLTIMVFAMLVVQSITLIIILRSPLMEASLNSQIISEISKLAVVNPNEVPSIIAIADADALRNANTFQAQVYKNSQRGDYVVSYSDKILIYRRSENKIVYEGDGPVTLQQKTQEKLKTTINAKALEAGLISDDSVTPRLSIVANAEGQRQENEFYAEVENEDVIAIYEDEEVIVIYRPSSDMIINSGSYSSQTVIN